MRVANTVHTARPWRIHEVVGDFRLVDVWALPTAGGPDGFPRLVQQMSSGDPATSSSRAAKALWAIRWKVGELLGWDGPDGGHGTKRPTLRERLPRDLREGPAGPAFHMAPFTSLYLLDDEWAAEIVNRTVHGIMHIGWVPAPALGYRGEMALREAERSARTGLHGRDRPVPPPFGLSRAHATDRARVASGRRRAGADAPVARPAGASRWPSALKCS